MDKVYDEKTSTVNLNDSNVNVGNTERVVSAIAGSALVAYGLNRADTTGVLLSILGGGLALRGATGHCQVYDAMDVKSNQEHRIAGGRTSNKKSSGLFSSRIHVKKSVTINKSPAELYQFWRNFENLPKFMSHLESVSNSEGIRSHWVAKAPFGTTVEWDAEITSERENERIGWNSVEGASVPNSGVVEFRPTSTRGTEVRVVLTYEPPAGKLGALVAKLFGEEPSQQVYGDLCRFKSMFESGEIITTEGQPSGRKKDAAKAAKA